MMRDQADKLVAALKRDVGHGGVTHIDARSSCDEMCRSFVMLSDLNLLMRGMGDEDGIRDDRSVWAGHVLGPSCSSVPTSHDGHVHQRSFGCFEDDQTHPFIKALNQAGGPEP